MVRQYIKMNLDARHTVDTLRYHTTIAKQLAENGKDRSTINVSLLFLSPAHNLPNK